jgi:hypothetical protein
MHDKHLRSDEIELLLDGEEGFGVAPLRAHVHACLSCRQALAEARKLMVALDALSDFAPSPHFADRVMAQVQVFEPWHAAAARTFEQFVPAGRTARVAAGLGAAVAAGFATAGATWVVARADMAFILTRLGAEGVRDQIAAAVSDLASTVLGQPGLDVVRTGTPEVAAVAVGGFVAVVGMGVVGLRALVTTSRHAREG